jgi:hypothetical protein
MPLQDVKRLTCDFATGSSNLVGFHAGGTFELYETGSSRKSDIYQTYPLALNALIQTIEASSKR